MERWVTERWPAPANIDLDGTLAFAGSINRH
jgi:hypothetical protein